MSVLFLEGVEQAREALLGGDEFRLLIADCDDPGADLALRIIEKSNGRMPVVLLSLQPDKGPMIQLLESYDLSHLVAKHGAIRVSKTSSGRPVYAMLDERELLVTCEKVLSRDIFGIDKYIGAWGVVFNRRRITSLAEKGPFLDELENYVRDLACPAAVVPDIVTVAEEFLLNAIVHAPRRADGTPKYEHLGPRADIRLDPNEYVEVVYGCDGQRLMISVSDNFGGLGKKTLFDYLRRGFHAGVEPEQKASGGGLGLSLSLRSVHQIVFNVQDQVRTEAIAGWYLRVQSAQEFRSVGKSLNVFWLDATETQVSTGKIPRFRLVGRIDELIDLAGAAGSREIDLRDVTAITSRGLIRWIEFIRSLQGKGVELIALPAALVAQAANVSGVVDGVSIRTVLMPFECPSCGFEERREMTPQAVLTSPGGSCPECKSEMRFAGLAAEYESFLGVLAQQRR